MILSGRAPFLLSEITDDIVDGEILEKHLPVFLEWGTSFAIAAGAETPSLYIPDAVTKSITAADIAQTLEKADRALIFA